MDIVKWWKRRRAPKLQQRPVIVVSRPPASAGQLLTVRPGLWK